jgi:SAM-dependent methyltransferase
MSTMTAITPVAKTPEELSNLEVFTARSTVDYYAQKQGLMPAEDRAITAAFPSPPARVLDVGCGAGRTTSVLLARGFEVVAGDILPAMVERARLNCPGARIDVLDAAALPFPAASFDAVLFSFNGLDYLYPFERRVKALREIHRVLRPGGAFVYSSHNILARFTRRWRPFLELARAHWRLLRQSCSRAMWQGYWSLPDHDGWLVTYAGLPATQLRTLRRLGFDPLGLFSQHATSFRGILLRDHWPYYAARKRVPPGGSLTGDSPCGP